MAQWRIRVTVPDGPGGHQALAKALARVSATQIRPGAQQADGECDCAGYFVVELAEEESLGDLLRTLHEISPQVFIGRVSAAEADGPPAGKTRTRRLHPIASVP